GMKRGTAPRTNRSFVARSRSHRLSEPARRTPRSRPILQSEGRARARPSADIRKAPLFLAGDLRDRGPLAVGRSELSRVVDLAGVLLHEGVAELHLLPAHHPVARPDELALLPSLRGARRPAAGVV